VGGDRGDFNRDSLPVCEEAGLEFAVVWQVSESIQVPTTEKKNEEWQVPSPNR
jgi:hypothetical protein